VNLLAGLAAALVVVLAVPASTRARLTLPAEPVRSTAETQDRLIRRRRWLLAGLAGVGGYLFVGGRAAPVVAVGAAIAAWCYLGRSESPDERRTRRQVRRDLPHLVDLLAAALRSGATPGAAVRLACASLPGPAADRLSGVTRRLELGVEPAQVWESLSEDAELAPLGRALARSHRTGAGVVPTVEQLAEELARASKGQVEERARTVGVRAALPLGLCLLPSFLLLGIVPLVVGLLSELSL
jgi:Flp pilus assembly protein TadB